jgi:hypothetical protein
MSTVIRFGATLAFALSLMLQSHGPRAAGGTRPARETLSLDWYTVDGGGAMWCTGGSLELSATIGQPDTDTAMAMTGGSLSLVGGFWPGVSRDSSLSGDCDVFSACMSGPEVDMEAGCECADMDGDVDVDLADFAAFQPVFAGS